MKSIIHNRLTIAAVLASALLIPASAGALAGSSYQSCGLIAAAPYLHVTHPIFAPDPSTPAGRSFPPLVGNQWSVTLTHHQHAASPSDCQPANAIASTNSSLATATGQVRGADGSSCTFTPVADLDHGKGVCDNGALAVTFEPAPIASVPDHTRCGRLRAPQPAGSRPFRRGYVWGVGEAGSSCAEAKRVVPLVWRVPVFRVRQGRADLTKHESIRTAAGSGGARWYCGVWGLEHTVRRRSRLQLIYSGGGVCHAEVNAPGLGWVRLGPTIDWAGPIPNA